MEWQSVLITLARKKKKMPKNSSQTFKSNTFVSRTVNILKVPRVNLELWDGLLDKVKSRELGFQAFEKGLIKGNVSVVNHPRPVEAKKNKAQFIPVADAAYDLVIDALTLLENSVFEF